MERLAYTNKLVTKRNKNSVKSFLKIVYEKLLIQRINYILYNKW